MRLIVCLAGEIEYEFMRTFGSTGEALEFLVGECCDTGYSPTTKLNVGDKSGCYYVECDNGHDRRIALRSLRSHVSSLSCCAETDVYIEGDRLIIECHE